MPKKYPSDMSPGKSESLGTHPTPSWNEYPYLIIDARYEKLRENGVIRSRAVLVAIGIDWEGRRQVLGVEMANRESSTSFKEFLLGLKRRDLRGVVFAVSDDHPGLMRAIIEVLPEAYWQRCYVHFLRNALEYRLSNTTIMQLQIQ
jgi:putative transposase